MILSHSPSLGKLNRLIVEWFGLTREKVVQKEGGEDVVKRLEERGVEIAFEDVSF